MDKFCHAVRETDNKIKWRERVETSVAPQRVIDYGIGAGGGAGAGFLFSPPPSTFIFCYRSNFRGLTRLETLATQATLTETLIIPDITKTESNKQTH